MELQRLGHNLVAKQQQEFLYTVLKIAFFFFFFNNWFVEIRIPEKSQCCI